MSLPFKLHTLAETDIVDGWRWYEEQRAGLGDQFFAAVEATITRASRWPNTGTPAIVSDGGEIVERKLATPGFPYAIRYRVTSDLLVIMAVYHQHRHPGFAADRSP